METIYTLFKCLFWSFRAYSECFLHFSNCDPIIVLPMMITAAYFTLKTRRLPLSSLQPEGISREGKKVI